MIQKQRFVVIFCWMLTAAVWAQPFGLDDDRARNDPRRQTQTPREMFGDQMVLLSLQQIEGFDAPTAAQLEAGSILLEQALELIPNDAELWQMKATLLQQQGDTAGWAKAMQQYVRLSPDNDAALLELIMYRVGQEQTLQDRIKRVERVLTSAPAGSMSDALQSRLAIYLAKSALEQGDQSMMLHWLRQAAKLDPTNAQAAAMTYELLVQRGASRQTLDKALMRWLSAAPADPTVRLMVAQRCFDTGLYRRAAQQFSMASQLSSNDLPPEIFQPWISSLIASGQARDALRLIYSLEASIKASKPEEDALTQWPGNENNDRPDEDQYRLPFSIMLLRQIVSYEDDLANASQVNWMELQRCDESDAGEGKATLLDGSLAWFTAFYAPDTAQAAVLIDEMPEDQADTQAAKLFLAIREQAEADIQPLMQAMPVQDTRLLYAAAFSAESDDEQGRLLQRLVREQPGTLLGVLASRDLINRSEIPNPSLEGARIEADIRNMSRRVWYSDLQQEPWVVLHVMTNQGRYSYLDPMICEVRINNNARAPLAIGNGRAIAADGVLVVSATVNGRNVGRVPPIFFNFDQRLALDTDQSVKTQVRLDRSFLGLLTSDNPDLNFNLRITSVMNPKIMPNMAIVPGPTGLARRVHSVFRLGMSPTLEMVNRWVRQIEDRVNNQMRFKALARLSRLNPPLLREEDIQNDQNPRSVGELFVEQGDGRAQVRRRLTEEQRLMIQTENQAVQAVLGRYPQMDMLEKAWILRFIPPIDDRPSAYAMILKDAAQSDHTLVRLTYLATQVTTSDDPALTAAIDSNDQTVQRFAKARKQLLEDLEVARRAAETAAQTDTETLQP